MSAETPARVSWRQAAAVLVASACLMAALAVGADRLSGGTLGPAVASLTGAPAEAGVGRPEPVRVPNEQPSDEAAAPVRSEPRHAVAEPAPVAPEPAAPTIALDPPAPAAPRAPVRARGGSKRISSALAGAVAANEVAVPPSPATLGAPEVSAAAAAGGADTGIQAYPGVVLPLGALANVGDEPARRRSGSSTSGSTSLGGPPDDPCQPPANYAASADELCMGTILGPSVSEQRVTATTGLSVHFEIPDDGCAYVLLTRGSFQFSATGFQDALRRWHEPMGETDPACVSCELTSQEAKVSFVIDGRARKPAIECPFHNVYVHVLESDIRGFDVAIHDSSFASGNAYADNSGGLTASLHRLPPSAALVARDAEGLRLGSPVGDAVADTWVGAEPTGDDLAAFLLAVKALGGDPFSLITFTEPEVLSVAAEHEEFIVEVSGLATLGNGQELDPGQAWDTVQKTWAELKVPVVDFAPCRRVGAVADPFSHRYLYRVTGCQGTLAASLTRTDFIGRFRVQAWRTR
jgi:hypothetical protein